MIIPIPAPLYPPTTRPLASASTAIPYTDLANTTHAADIAAIAAAGITTGCGGTNYCPFNPVTRAQMASFLTRAFKLERVYPQINLVAGIPLQCSKDGLACRASITVPYRAQYELREGFYDVLHDPALEAGFTRIELTINGSPISMTPLPVQTGRLHAFRNFYIRRMTNSEASNGLVGKEGLAGAAIAAA